MISARQACGAADATSFSVCLPEGKFPPLLARISAARLVKVRILFSPPGSATQARGIFAPEQLLSVILNPQKLFLKKGVGKTT